MSDATRAASAGKVSSAVPAEGIVRFPLAEEFCTLQGEGFQTGTAAAFIRLGGCPNGCPWCDTEAAQTTDNCRWLTATEIAAMAAAHKTRTAVVTGGEPLIRNLDMLTEELHKAGMRVFLETSGTHPLSGDFDWICLSPKPFAPPAEPIFAKADEIKVVIGSRTDLQYAEQCASKAGSRCKLYLQPEWNTRRSSIPLIVEYIKQHPEWKLSLQMHKYIDIP